MKNISDLILYLLLFCVSFLVIVFPMFYIEKTQTIENIIKYAYENNITIKELHYNINKRIYKQKYTDWKEIREVKLP